MIYLDNAATTAIDKDVLSSYVSLLNEYYANPASIHKAGQDSFRLLSKAREQIIKLFDLPNYEVIFTSGSTEAINLALKGFAFANENRGKHLITSAIEHPAVLNALKQLRDQFGFRLTILPVNKFGVVSVDDVKNNMSEDTILVAIMTVNNEIGSIQPVSEISKIVRNYPKAVFFSDTTQAVGKIAIQYSSIDMFVISAHKINGLKGSGALIKRKGINLLPLASGGGQENNYRSGTSDFPVHVMLAKTLRLAFERLEEHENSAKKLTSLLREELANRINIVRNSPINGSPFILNFSLTDKKASVVIEALSSRGIMVSSVSACSSTKFKTSDVLTAMGLDEKLSSNSIRVSVGCQNTIEEIQTFIRALDEVMSAIR